ncbi:hypothetical protein [Armatimonas sp.]|uniref:hypothetical protein n=1 Tax=Armatimonas sp. TaxID=1872638 RepID=UPI0037526489
MTMSPYDYLKKGAKFAPGKFYFSQNALDAIKQSGLNPGRLMDRHLGMDWEQIGCGSLIEQLRNDVAAGAAIQSTHGLPTGAVIIIETQEDRSQTIMCTQEEAPKYLPDSFPLKEGRLVAAPL